MPVVALQGLACRARCLVSSKQVCSKPGRRSRGSMAVYQSCFAAGRHCWPITVTRWARLRRIAIRKTRKNIPSTTWPFPFLSISQIPARSVQSTQCSRYSLHSNATTIVPRHVNIGRTRRKHARQHHHCRPCHQHHTVPTRHTTWPACGLTHESHTDLHHNP